MQTNNISSSITSQLSQLQTRQHGGQAARTEQPVEEQGQNEQQGANPVNPAVPTSRGGEAAPAPLLDIYA